jgi:hypothetical protein
MQGFFVNNFGDIAFVFAYNFLPFTKRISVKKTADYGR